MKLSQIIIIGLVALILVALCVIAGILLLRPQQGAEPTATAVAEVTVPAEASVPPTIESGVDETIAGLVLMILALIELVSGNWIGKREGQLRGALPFYTLACCLALLVTGMALADTDALIKVLFGDVLLLVFVTWIFKDYRWVYGAVWLFMLPIYLIVDMYGDIVTQ